jgi:4-amino-4-deoxy-L-arabinose transferase-like glycosyltransferase
LIESEQAGRRRFVLADVVVLFIVVALACTLLFWNLGLRYLWQDEAATAVLAERMLRFGKPLGYDGHNLITMDITSESDRKGFEHRIRSAQAAVLYHAERGDFKPDTTWTGQPWGQFVLAAASLETLGHDTFSARLPFALCGVLTVVALYALVRRWFDDVLMAWLACLLLLANVYWVLHMRQCRYYAPSSLFLLLTVIGYLRWQEGRRFATALFVATAWIWFQFDYGTFWPVVGLLVVDGLARQRRGVLPTCAAFAALAVAIAPWVVYYDLFSRLQETSFPWHVKQLSTLFKVNQFVMPLLLMAAVAWLFQRERNTLPVAQRQALVLSFAIIGLQLAWVPLVATAAHYRYFVGVTPLACLLLAYGVVRVPALLGLGRDQRLASSALSAALALLVAASPLVSNLLVPLIPVANREVDALGTWLRAEWGVLWRDLGGQVRDPNRELVEFLRPRLQPGDEILATYEDVPLMFYLPEHRIRGGLAGFRLRETEPPRFFVGKTRLPYQEFQFEAVQRYLESQVWKSLDHDIPDFFASNCPDPSLHFSRFLEGNRKLQIAEHQSDP